MLSHDPEPMLYSVSDVARIIRFSRSKTYEMIRGGKIPHIVVEDRIRVRHKNLLAWINRASRHH
jgi:excisionase family DNA binding protein